jgi:hypothetical protein
LRIKLADGSEITRQLSFGDVNGNRVRILTPLPPGAAIGTHAEARTE